MTVRHRWAGIAALATTIVALAISSASAIEMTVSPGGAVRAIGTTTFEGEELPVSCALTLTNSLLTGPITAATGNQIGELTGAEIGSCTGGEIERFLSLPSRIVFNHFLPEGAERRTATGVLVTVVGVAVGFTRIGGIIACLYRGDALGLIALTATSRGENRYTFRTIRWLETASLPFFFGSAGCPRQRSLSGTHTFSTTQTVTLS